MTPLPPTHTRCKCTYSGSKEEIEGLYLHISLAMPDTPSSSVFASSSSFFSSTSRSTTALLDDKRERVPDESSGEGGGGKAGEERGMGVGAEPLGNSPLRFELVAGKRKKKQNTITLSFSLYRVLTHTYMLSTRVF